MRASEANTRRTYRIAESLLTIDFGSVLDVGAEVVVSSDDYQLTMGGGVSAAIRMAAGNALVLDASKAVPREEGDIVVTTAGALPARYVFHAVTIGPRKWVDRTYRPDIPRLIRRATLSCLELMMPLGVRSIAFPALGTGTARLSHQCLGSCHGRSDQRRAQQYLLAATRIHHADAARSGLANEVLVFL